MYKLKLCSLVPEGKNLTRAWAAILLSIFDDPRLWEDPREYEMILAGVQCSDEPLPLASKVSERKDSRPFNAEEETAKPPPITIFTNYPHLQLQEDPEGCCDDSSFSFQFISERENADFLFVLENVTNFYSISERQRICQFPYEGGYVRKDLLPLTVRRYCIPESNSVAPFWWLDCFDLSTEFHLFRREFLSHFSSSSPSSPTKINDWIVKPAQGTHAIGHQIFFGDEENCLQKLACYVAGKHSCSST